MIMRIGCSWSNVPYVRESVVLTGLKGVQDSAGSMQVLKLHQFVSTGERSLPLAVQMESAIFSLRAAI